jgi:hypothetical protein
VMAAFDRLARDATIDHDVVGIQSASVWSHRRSVLAHNGFRVNMFVEI